MTSGGPLVLVVDDEEEVAEMAATVLRQGGFLVLLASSAEDANRIIHDQAPAIFLIICDYRVGADDGSGLLRTWQALVPQATLALMSGYPLELIEVAPELRGGLKYLPKPFPIADLTGLARLAAANFLPRSTKNEASGNS
ncbi:MAG TPA: response regulator [Methylomirabilota bacterium]|nr:response regulator [Methylomirabilota bacterium]